MPAAELADLAREMKAVALLEGDFVLRSGKRSRYYFDKYLFECEPDILRRLGVELARLVPAGTQRLACPELGAVLSAYQRAYQRHREVHAELAELTPLPQRSTLAGPAG